MKIAIKIMLMLLIFLCILNFTSVYAASGLRLKNLTMDVAANRDGSINVKETWEISIGEVNTLYKVFYLDNPNGVPNKYSNIRVREVHSNGRTTEFREVYRYSYHLEKGTYYGLNHEGNFEIAWGVSENNTTKIYEIEYTMSDVVTNQVDCAELYWKMVGQDFEIPIDNFEATIKLPWHNYEEEDILIWLHGPLNGFIEHVDSENIRMGFGSVSSNTMLEVRIVTPKDLFYGLKTAKTNMTIEKIIEEETRWAEVANRMREMQKIMGTLIFVVIGIVSIVIMIVLSIRIPKKLKLLKETEKIKPIQKIEYYREIPGENANPGHAGFLMYGVTGSIEGVMPQILSATLLDFSLKKYVEFGIKEGSKNNKEIIVRLTGKSEEAKLKGYEVLFDTLLQIVASSNTKQTSDNEFTMKDLEKYARKNQTSFLMLLEKMGKNIEKEQIEKGNYDKELNSKYKKYSGRGIGYIFLAFFAFIWLPISIPALINGILNIKIASRYMTFTQKGEDEKEQWKGLKKYMEHYSLLKEREVPDIVLWEKFLVYATCFGISAKVIKQLKITYPQFNDENYMRSTYGGSYMYYAMSSNFAGASSFTSALSSSMSSVVSSGGGSGGGSSGGGGRRITAAADGGGR